MKILISPAKSLDFESKEKFESWLKTIKGKHVLLGDPDISGRPDYDIERWAKEKTLEEIRKFRITKRNNWNSKRRT